MVGVDIWTAPKAGSQPLYFLPWQQNAATSLRIPANHGPAVFMTSILSGCTVQVYGPANNPSICHANAANTYSQHYTNRTNMAQKMTPEQTHAFAEGWANHATTTKIDTMLPTAPPGAVCRTVRKSDYAGKLDTANLNRFQRNYAARLATSESLTDFEVSKHGLKPRTGAFVFGLRDGTGNWEFFYQAAVDVELEVQDKFSGAPPRRMTMESAVLGQPERFFP